MIQDIIKNIFGQDIAPIVIVVVFVVIVGCSLWLTPKLARWIDENRSKNRGFYDDMMEEPPKTDNDKEVETER